MKDEAFEQFMAILFLRALNQIKYGKIQDDYRMDYTNKRYNYPKSIVDMVDFMRQVKIIKKTSPSDEEKVRRNILRR